MSTETSPAEIRLAAMNLLARREHTQRELKQKLQRRFGNLDLLPEVIQRLTDENLQSDERFTEAFISARKRKGQGPVRIELELRERGVQAELSQAYLDADDDEWIEMAKVVWRKRFAGAPTTPKEQMQQRRFLQYRGFTSQQIERAIKSNFEEEF